MAGKAAGGGGEAERILLRAAVSKPGAEAEQGVREGAQRPSEREQVGELIKSSANFSRSPCAASVPGLETAPEGTMSSDSPSPPAAFPRYPLLFSPLPPPRESFHIDNPQIILYNSLKLST